tara:strand:- start:158 stop:1042 length:885 start_codon:yes stop_codon:yes gene_type:complete
MKPTSENSKDIGIVGLGLIGGSLGLDLQNLGYLVHGLVHRAKTAERAKERGLAQIIDTNPKILSNCSIVIIALPISKILKPEPQLIEALPSEAVITDVASVKAPVLEVWKNLHPYFVASHPMAGTEKAGVEAGQRNLFKDKAWITTPEEYTNSEAIERIRKLAISLGSQWVTSKADVHDEVVALISHLPVLVSSALLQVIGKEQNPSKLNLAKELASTGFADTSRVGGGNPDLGVSMMKNNKGKVLNTLNIYKQSIEELEEVILSQKWEKLNQILLKNQVLRSNFMQKKNNSIG